MKKEFPLSKVLVLVIVVSILSSMLTFYTFDITGNAIRVGSFFSQRSAEPINIPKYIDYKGNRIDVSGLNTQISSGITLGDILVDLNDRVKLLETSSNSATSSGGVRPVPTQPSSSQSPSTLPNPLNLYFSYSDQIYVVNGNDAELGVFLHATSGNKPVSSCDVTYLTNGRKWNILNPNSISGKQNLVVKIANNFPDLVNRAGLRKSQLVLGNYQFRLSCVSLDSTVGNLNFFAVGTSVDSYTGNRVPA